MRIILNHMWERWKLTGLTAMAISRARWQRNILSGAPEHIYSARLKNMLLKKGSQSRRVMLTDQNPRESPRNKRGELSQSLEGKWFPQEQGLRDGHRAGHGKSTKEKILECCLSNLPDLKMMSN